MKAWSKSRGLIVATFTPMHQDGSINLDKIPSYIDHLNAQGITQAYVNGTAGEFASLSVPERKAIAEKWLEAGKGKMTRLIIHCGTGSLAETKELATHAESIGADCVAAVAPTYFKPLSAAAMVDYCAEVAKCCPQTPFMYYHFPGATGITNVRVTDFLRIAEGVIPNLIGAKFTSADLHDVGQALRVADGKYDIIVGADAIFLSAMAMGVDSAIGVSFNILGRPFNRLCEAFYRGDLQSARQEQYRVQDLLSLAHTAGNNHEMVSHLKAITGMTGLDLGPPRLPVPPATPETKTHLRKQLNLFNFNQWTGLQIAE